MRGTPLSEAQPELAAQWHPTKNDSLTPHDVSSAAHIQVWWQCEKGHEFEKSINSRYNSGRGITGCPICANREVLAGYNDLATTNPRMAAEWHPVRNGDLYPSSLTANSHTNVWWQCENGHEWQVKPNKRSVNGSGCPICANQKIISGVNDLATDNPALALEWHPEKNGDLLASQVSPHTATKVWWLCPRGHEYEISVNARNDSKKGTSCPVCSNKKLLVGHNDLSTLFPSIASQWHHAKNGTLNPSEVPPSYRNKVWWCCSENPSHEWFQSPADRTSKGTNCAICSGKQVQTGTNDVSTVSPELAKEWHPTRNNIDPSKISIGSKKNVWWLCSKGHEWKQTPNGRQHLGCPICSNKQILIGYNDLQSTRPDIAARWHHTKNETHKTTSVTAGSSKKVWWSCPTNESHYFQMTVVEVVNGRGCAVCAGKQIIVGVNDLATVRPQLIDEWHQAKNNGREISSFTASSHFNAWWICPKGHEYQSPVASRSNGSGCPICDNKVVLVGYNDMATTHAELAKEWHPTKNGDLSPSNVVAGSLKKFWWQCPEGHEWQTTGTYRVSGTGCPTCATFGFDPNKPGIVYFIENNKHLARKIGITNQDLKKSRIEQFQKAGWTVIRVWNISDGSLTRKLESEMLRWIRKDQGLPQYLGSLEMKFTGGATETFSAEGPSNLEIIQRIEDELASLTNP